MDLAVTAAAADLPGLDDIIDNFAVLDDWEDRYRYVIELGRGLPPMADAERCDANKVLTFSGDSDAHIVRGLVAILLATVSGKPPAAVLATDPIALFEQLGLREHLTPQRSNGFRSMVDRVRRDAERALAGAV